MARWQSRKEAAEKRMRFRLKPTTEAEVDVMRAQADIAQDLARDGKVLSMPDEIFDDKFVKGVRAKSKKMKVEVRDAEKKVEKERVKADRTIGEESKKGKEVSGEDENKEG